MKHILTMAVLLASLASYSQDTLCVMLTQESVVHFDFKSSDVLSKREHSGDLTLNIDDGHVMCLHLYDEEDRFRDLTTTFSNGDHIHGSFNSKNNVFFSKIEWGSFEVHISESRIKK